MSNALSRKCIEICIPLTWQKGEIYTGVGLLQHHLNRGKNQIPNTEVISLYMYMEGTAYCGAQAL